MLVLYLALGGVGFIIGDGALNYGQEKMLESYYTVQVWKGLYVAPDVQHIVNPGVQRGPRSRSRAWISAAH